VIQQTPLSFEFVVQVEMKLKVAASGAGIWDRTKSDRCGEFSAGQEKVVIIIDG
jgi:hypothetical protein